MKKQTIGNTMAAKVIEHRDLLGKVIKVGDVVAYCSGNEQLVGSVLKLTPKRVKVNRVTAYMNNEHYKRESYQCRPENTVVVEGPHVMTYIIKHSA